MKDFLIGLVRDAADELQGRNLAREYLQARILGALQKEGAMIPLAFHGGTALRFLYGHQRFSEDLDFALEHAKKQYSFREYLHAIRKEFTSEGYSIELKVSDQKVVHSAFVRFPGLLYELGLSAHESEVLSIKLEVDTKPPAGARLETTLVRRFVLLQLQHHDRSSLLAGKLHAVLQRGFTKGRDLFDLIWYLSDPDWPSPNFHMLNNALQQTDWSKPKLTKNNWREIVYHHLTSVDWGKVQNDVQPFLEPGFNIQLLSKGNLEKLLLGPKQ